MKVSKNNVDKIDANATYGTLGMYTSLVYNNNVASSITASGRAAVSSMIMHFEMMLADNVKFGSLDQVLEFINNVCKEYSNRKFDDKIVLDYIPDKVDCFTKLVLDCGYRWIPNEKELDILWQVVNNLSQDDITRIYYKNNLYAFVSNSYVMNLIKKILKTLDSPFFTSAKVPPEIADDLNYLKDLVMDYVYYRYLFIDRIDRADNMLKAVTMVSDTDSTIISVDAWYKFIAANISGEKLKINNDCEDVKMADLDALDEAKEEKESGKNLEEDIEEDFEVEKEYEYDFKTDSMIEVQKMSHPEVSTGDNNVRYSIISILSYILDHTVNDYMIKMCENMNSIDSKHLPKDCKIYAKTEFLFARLMLVPHAKKNYASIMEIQEGNMVPFDKQLDTKGIEAIHKSSKPKSTRDALKKILLEDVLRAPQVDQLKFIKDIAVLEKTILDDVKSGSKTYYKPATIKSMNSYDDPLRIQGIKASVAWNMIRPDDLEAINLNERNAVNIAKVHIDRANVEDIKEKFPEIYNNMIKALDDETFKKYTSGNKSPKKLVANEITAIAIPLDVEVPDWLKYYIDYDSIIIDNLAGFPYESIGIQRLNRGGVAYTNIVQL